jgi:hypothetical protein
MLLVVAEVAIVVVGRLELLLVTVGPNSGTLSILVGIDFVAADSVDNNIDLSAGFKDTVVAEMVVVVVVFVVVGRSSGMVVVDVDEAGLDCFTIFFNGAPAEVVVVAEVAVIAGMVVVLLDTDDCVAVVVAVVFFFWSSAAIAEVLVLLVEGVLLEGLDVVIVFGAAVVLLVEFGLDFSVVAVVAIALACDLWDDDL